MSRKFDVSSVLGATKLRRSLLYAPSTELSKLAKALQVKSLDTSVFDLEDGVPITKKEMARQNVVNFLRSNPRIELELAVRINQLGGKDCMSDLNTLFLDHEVGDKFKTVIIPKVEHPDEVKFVSRWLKYNGYPKTNMLAMIETPRGLTEVNRICSSSDMIDGVIFGAEDYRSAAGIKRGSIAPIQYARSAIVAAAKAKDIQAIDMTSINFRDKDVVLRDAIDSRNFGFTGKQVIHPMQVECVNQAFSLNEEQKKKNIDQLKQFVKTTYVDGKGVFGDNGEMVELPHITQSCRDLFLSGMSVREIQDIADSVL